MHEEVGRFALYTYLAAVSVQEARSFLQLFPPLQDDSHLSSTLKRFDGKRYVSEADGVDGDPGSGIGEAALHSVSIQSCIQIRTRYICSHRRSCKTTDGGTRVSAGWSSLGMSARRIMFSATYHVARQERLFDAFLVGTIPYGPAFALFAFLANELPLKLRRTRHARRRRK